MKALNQENYGFNLLSAKFVNGFFFDPNVTLTRMSSEEDRRGFHQSFSMVDATYTNECYVKQFKPFMSLPYLEYNIEVKIEEDALI